MSEYPRVKADRPSEFGAKYAPAENGPLMLVPADAIVIERSALPEVVVEGDGLLLIGGGRYVGDTDPALARRISIQYVAFAEYLDAHPPVDEEQVEALAEDVRNLEESAPFASDLARALIARGWHKDAGR